MENLYGLKVETWEDELNATEAVSELEWMIKYMVRHYDQTGASNFLNFLNAWKEHWSCIGADAPEVDEAIQEAIQELRHSIFAGDIRAFLSGRV